MKSTRSAAAQAAPAEKTREAIESSEANKPPSLAPLFARLQVDRRPESHPGDSTKGERVMSRREVFAGVVATPVALAMPAIDGIAASAPSVVDPDADLSAIRSRWLAAKVAQAARERGCCSVHEAALANLPKVSTTHTPMEIFDVGLAFSRIIARLHDQGIETFDLEDDPEWEAAFQEECVAIEDLAETPALTMAGLAFKAGVAQHNSCMDPELIASIMDDIAAFSAAFPTLALPPSA